MMSKHSYMRAVRRCLYIGGTEAPIVYTQFKGCHHVLDLSMIWLAHSDELIRLRQPPAAHLCAHKIPLEIVFRCNMAVGGQNTSIHSR